jgi:hypothetical protein
MVIDYLQNTSEIFGFACCVSTRRGSSWNFTVPRLGVNLIRQLSRWPPSKT